MSCNDGACLDRLLWRCRRGLLELDIVLEHFVVSRFDALAEGEQAQFIALLEMPDNELWDMIAGRIEAPEPFRAILQKIATP